MTIGFLTVLSSVGALILIGVPGYLFRKFNLIKQGGVKPLVILLIYLAQPFVIVMSFQSETTRFAPDMLAAMGQTALFAVAVHAAALVFAAFAFKGLPYDKKRKGAYVFASGFSNCGYMGIPFVMMLYAGDERLPLLLILLSVFIVVFNLVNWTVGIAVITADRRNMSLRRALLNPTTAALVVALPLFFTGVSLWDFSREIASAFDLVGKMTSPLAMTILGIKLAEMPIRDIFNSPPVYLTAFVKLIAAPLLTALILLPFKQISEPVRALVIVISAMPTATVTVANAEQFGGDAVESAKCLLATTLLCMVTIPLMCTLLL